MVGQIYVFAQETEHKSDQILVVVEDAVTFVSVVVATDATLALIITNLCNHIEKTSVVV